MFGLADDLAGDDTFIVFPENGDAVRVFCAAATQWRLGPRGGLAGFDYSGVQAAAAGVGIPWPAVFEGVRTMESEVLAAQAKAV